MKNYLLFLLLVPSIIISQTQIGSDIDGEAVNDRSGVSTSISSDGTIVAIGAYQNSGNGFTSGHVRVYSWNGTSWTQLGSDINGEASNDRSGWSVSLSSDGSRVAIGAYGNDGNGTDSGHVRVYSWNGTSWIKLGSDIDGEAVDDSSGESVSLSGDGSRVAIGAYNNDGNGSNSGHVRVYSWNGTSWMKLGDDIDGEAVNDRSGWSVSLSGDGSILAVGARRNDENGSDSGHVRVYSWNGTLWTQLGTDINGEAAGDYSGHSVSLSSNGTKVAIGAIYNDGNGSNSGHVRIYNWNGTSWVQLGSDIDSEAAVDQFGSSVSLNSDGSRVAIGAIGNDGNGSASGHVRVYSWSGTSWAQVGNDIDGEAAGDNFGGSVSLSSNSSRVAIGAFSNDGNGSVSGHVRVYDLSAVLSIESFKQDYFTFYPNPVKEILTIELKKGIELKQANLYNIQMQYLYSVRVKQIDVSQLSQGIYFLEVETNQGKSAKKIVIE